MAVREILVEAGIDDRLFRIEAVGAREPLNERAYLESEMAEHRRVDIVLTEDLLQPTGPVQTALFSGPASP